MPIFSVHCNKCNKDMERFASDSAVALSCRQCNGPVSKLFKEISFIPSEADLTFVSVRDRMQRGLYHDQTAAKERFSKEVNQEMQHNNGVSMGKLGFTEKEDHYDRSKDY